MAISFRNRQHRWIVRRGARRGVVHTAGGRWLRRYIVADAAVAALTSNVANDVEMTPQVRCDAMSAQLARSWRLVLLRGVLALLTGAVALLVPEVASASLVALFGGYVIADGVVAGAAGLSTARRHVRWSWLIIEGLLSVAAGILLVLTPAAAILSVIALLAVRGVVSGIAMAAAAFRLRTDHGRWWLVVGALTSITCGLLLLVLPPPGAVVLTLSLGAYAVVFGALLVLLACHLRARRALAASGR